MAPVILRLPVKIPNPCPAHPGAALPVPLGDILLLRLETPQIRALDISFLLFLRLVGSRQQKNKEEVEHEAAKEELELLKTKSNVSADGRTLRPPYVRGFETHFSVISRSIRQRLDRLRIILGLAR